MKTIFSKRADREIERINDYWGKHAYDPDVFIRELREAVMRLKTTPELGTLTRAKAHPHARRILLPKSRCHLFFEVDQREQVIHILRVWDARRAQPPKL